MWLSYSLLWKFLAKLKVRYLCFFIHLQKFTFKESYDEYFTAKQSEKFIKNSKFVKKRFNLPHWDRLSNLWLTKPALPILRKW